MQKKRRKQEKLQAQREEQPKLVLVLHTPRTWLPPVCWAQHREDRSLQIRQKNEQEAR